MIRVRQKRLVSIKVLILLSILVGCDFNSFNGRWYVESKTLKVEKESQFILEASPGVLENKFDRMFPNGLNENDELEIKNTGQLSINNSKRFDYKYSDTTIHVMSKDVVFPLRYNLESDKLILYRVTDQGKIEWILKRK